VGIIVDNVHYDPAPVTHDHGYCYLQAKDVSGAAFDGASDGVFMGSDPHRFDLENGRN
jgi:hypothetical protein